MDVRVCNVKAPSQKMSNIIVMINLVLAIVFCTATFSAMSSFYPILAESRLIKSGVIGVVFGAFQIGLLLFGPLIGYISTRVGVRITYIGSILTCSIMTLLFGFVNLAKDNVSFITLSVILRVFQGATYFGAQSACITMATTMYAADMSKAISIIEIANGIGFSVGPPIGGIFYQIGGYMTPFIFVSSICFTLFLASILFTKNRKQLEVNDEENDGKPDNVSSVFKILKIYIGIFNLSTFTMSYTYFDVSLSSFLREKFGMEEYEIGLIFAAECIMYAVTGPFVGHAVDKLGKPYIAMIAGSILCTVGFLLLGPAPFLNFESEVWIVAISVSIIGMALALMYMPTMEYFLVAIRENGLSENNHMKHNLSSILTYGGGVGGLIGPIIGGIILQYSGFQTTCFIIAMINLINGASIGIIEIFFKKDARNLDEETAAKKNSKT